MKVRPRRILSWFLPQPVVNSDWATDTAFPTASRAQSLHQDCSNGAPSPRRSEKRARRQTPAPVPVWRIRYEGEPYSKPCQTPAEDAAELVRWLQRTGYDDRWVSSPDLRELYENRCRELGRQPYGWHLIGQQILRLNGRQKRYGRLSDGTRVRAYYMPASKAGCT
jgi:hypothetical protein